MIQAITQQLKRFSDDERAVSPVVGFVLMFALIMILFTIYNADVVPAQNEGVEYEHSQMIEGQMEQLSAAFMSAEQNGSTRSVSLQLGVQYPTRAFGINPGTPVGTLSTTGPHDVTLTGDAETAEFNTSFVNYLPNYNLMTQETQYSIEHGLLVKDYSGSDNTRLKSTGALFSSDDETVNLRLINSNLQESRMSTVVTAENVGIHTITVTSGTADLNLPTTLKKEEWNRTISGSGQVEGWSYSNNPSGVNRVNIELKNGTAINVNRVTVGSPPPEGEIRLEPRITNVTPLHPEVEPLGTKTRVTVRTTDIFGSSLSGVDVDISKVNGSGELSTTTATSNGDGNVTFAYDPADTDSGSTVGITAELSNSSGENTSVTFGLEYPERYIVKESPDSPDASIEESEQLAVSVLDGNDDPLSNVNLEASADGDGSITTPTTTTNDTGGATFTYEPADSDSGSTVTVTIKALNGSENGPVEFGITYPSAESGSSGGGISGSVAGQSRTNPRFHVSFNDPMTISQFSITAKGNLSNLDETNNRNVRKFGMRLYQTQEGPNLQKRENERIQLDGRKYDFDDPRTISDSDGQILKFDSGNGIHLLKNVDSRSEADLVITFYNSEGSSALYFTADQRGRN